MIDYKFEKWAAEAFDVKVEDLFKTGRLNDNITYARYICYLHLTRHTGLTLNKIALRYGKKGGYSALSYGLRRARELIEIKDSKFIIGIFHYNDRLEEHNIIKNDNFKKLDKAWTFTDRDIKSMIFMKENNIQSYKIALHYSISLNDLKYILKNK